MEKVIVIVGQTGIGKTSLSLDLAKKLNTEIINGDAYQVYREFSIITDKIIDTQGVPHHMLNTKSISENYDVFTYQKDVRKAILDVNNKGKIPILVGGSGFYIKAALYDYEFSITNNDDTQSYDNIDNETLYKMLENIDSEAASKIHPNNRKRVVRALNIAKSGTLKSDIEKAQEHKLIYDALFIAIKDDIDIANDKIDNRIEKMFDEGIIDEVRNNITTTTASKAIGYKEINDYLYNGVSLEKTKELMKIHTHQYAKRQRTWIRNQFEVNYLLKDDNLLNNALKLIDDKFKTM